MTVTLQTLYADIRDKKGDHEVARVLVGQRDWFYWVAEFDPKSGEALPQSLSSVLAKVAQYTPPSAGEPIRDRLWRIAEHSRPSIERLFRALNESPRREQALLPVRAVRELDASSFIKLSNRPGRNIREKLAGKPYLQAVRRFQSTNLPENRLLKEFATRLNELLELRMDCLSENGDDLLRAIQSWLRSDEVRAIARWENLPPNNALLAHRDYRRIWDAWRWLQTLDEDIANDLSQLEARDKTIRLWTKYAQMWADGGYLFAEMPILFNYEVFLVRPWIPELAVRKTSRRLTRSSTTEPILKPVCIDLSVLHPRFATATKSSQALCDNYFWQHWENDNESVDVELFRSDAAYIHPDATSISAENQFFSADKTSECFERSVRAFATRLRGVFKSDTLIWLVPDSLNDFELEVIRRNLNARFPDAKPLPRSVAAIFEHVDYSKIKNDGFPIAVVDSVGGITCVTKLLARFDPALKETAPETCGFYWERCPPVVITNVAPENTEEKGHDFITVDEQGKWRDATQPETSGFIDLSELKGDSRIGEFAFCINLAESPVVGGIRLHSLQQFAGEIPLWRDQISELSIKIMDGGRYQRFPLVSRGTTVAPIRGVGVLIPVDESFKLPAGKPVYRLPLFKGEDADELGFFARLDSPAFPLKEDVVCKLNLTFEYGADEPYKLVFIPLDKSFPPVRATWRKTEEEIIVNAPWPEYPKPMTWAELRHVPKLKDSGTRDHFEWASDAIDQLDGYVFRTTGTITSDWERENNGEHFTYVRCDQTEDDVKILENSFVIGFSFREFKSGDKVSFELQGTGKIRFGARVARAGYAVQIIRKRLYVPIITVWRDGRSITHTGCPSEFTNGMGRRIKHLVALLRDEATPNPVKNEILFLLSCMHKDAPHECVQWIENQVKNASIHNPQAVGFALGDVSERWQQDILAKLVAKPTADSLLVFAYAIWREQHFVEKFSLAELQSVLEGLAKLLGLLFDLPPLRLDIWSRTTVALLELLLGLLRTRALSDRAIKMLLQPHQKITKELAAQVERAAEIVARNNIELTSRVQIDIEKPESERSTSDLVYALRLYLTGDDGANAIHVAIVSDGGND